MSSVRMCDRCGNIFSERQEGWGTYQGTIFKKDDTGRRYQETAVLDQCPNCNPDNFDVPELTPKTENDNFLKLKQLESENAKLKREAAKRLRTTT